MTRERGDGTVTLLRATSASEFMWSDQVENIKGVQGRLNGQLVKFSGRWAIWWTLDQISKTDDHCCTDNQIIFLSGVLRRNYEGWWNSEGYLIEDWIPVPKTLKVKGVDEGPQKKKRVYDKT